MCSEKVLANPYTVISKSQLQELIDHIDQREGAEVEPWSVVILRGPVTLNAGKDYLGFHNVKIDY